MVFFFDFSGWRKIYYSYYISPIFGKKGIRNELWSLVYAKLCTKPYSLHVVEILFLLANAKQLEIHFM